MKTTTFPHLALGEFWPFLKIKGWLKYRGFASLQEIQQKERAGTTAITNRTSRYSSTSGNTPVACVCVRVRTEGNDWV